MKMQALYVTSLSWPWFPVNASYRDPLPGWIGNFNGPILFFVVVSKGLFRVGYHKNEPVDYVPVDMCINMGVALIWDIIANKYVHELPRAVSCIMYLLLHLTEGKREKLWSSTMALAWRIPLHLRTCTTWLSRNIERNPLFKVFGTQKFLLPQTCLWQSSPTSSGTSFHWCCTVCTSYYGKETQSKFDASNKIECRRWCMIADFSSIMKLYNIAQFFFNNARFMLDGYKIHTTNCLEICDRMADADKEIFFCDVRKIDWEEYVGVLWRGLRVYCLKESMNNLEEARKKHRKLYIIHLLFQGAVLAFIFYLLSDYIYSAINFFSSDWSCNNL